MTRRAVSTSFLNSFTNNDHALSVTVPAGLNNSILVITRSCNSDLPWATFTGITVNGSATGIVDAGTSGNLGANRSVRTWYLLAPAAGTYDVVLSFSTSSANAGLLSATVYDDIDQATPIHDFKAATGGSVASPIASPAFSSAAPGFVVAHGRAFDATAVAPGGGGAALGAVTRPDEVAFELTAGATAASMSWTGIGSTQASIVALALKPAGGGGDTTAPVLSSPVGTQTGSTTATVGATTDEGNGTLYAVVTTSATQPSVAQIKAGQNDGGTTAAWSGSVTVSSTGAKTINAIGLTASTTYYAHLVHTDAATNNSNRVSSASFTTAAATVYGFDFHTATGLVFGDLAGALTSLARQASVAMVARAYNTSTGALVATSGTLTTDSAGRLPRWTDAALVNATQYTITFTRASDGEVCATRMTAT